MKKLLAFSLIGSTLFSGTQAVKSNETSYGITQGGDYGIKVYSVNPDNGNSTLLGTYCRAWDNMGNAMCAADVGSDSYLNETTGNLIIELNDAVNGNKMVEFNTTDKTFTEGSPHSNWKDNYQILIDQKVLTKSADGKIKLQFEGTKLIETQNGITSIGPNSLKLQESSGVEKMWATDASGKSIPIDITNGSKLLIKGRDVEQSINNVGALSAALTGLPTVPTDTTLACGLGTGTHGGDFAFSGGCASKVNEKLSINYAASITMPGQDYAGDFEDTFSVRGGFVWKLGKSLKPTQISMNEKKVFETKIKTLEDKNNQLLARLEKLEKITFADLNLKDLAVYNHK